MTMTLDDVLEQSGVMLGVGKLPTEDQLIAWREAIALHLAGMGEPAAFTTPSMNVVFRPGRYPGNGVDLYTAPPIDLAAVREVIAEMRSVAEKDDHLLHGWADKLESAIATQPKEPKS